LVDDQWHYKKNRAEEILEIETMDLGRLEGKWDKQVADSETLQRKLGILSRVHVGELFWTENEGLN